MPVLVPGEDVYCKTRCSLYRNVLTVPPPEEGRLAWEVWRYLAGPAVEKYNLAEYVLESLDLDLDQLEFLNLISGLNAIEIGLIDAQKVLDEEAAGKA